MILSGLRVFDISDPYHPKEIAYFNAPIADRGVDTGIFTSSNYAMSSPSFVPERNEIWYSDGFSGFYAVRLTNQAAVLGGGCNEAAAPTGSPGASETIRSRAGAGATVSSAAPAAT